MSNEEPVDGNCNAQTRDGGYCALKAGYKTDHVGDGRCKYHGGASNNEGNQNAKKHGIYSQRSNYYNDLPGEEQAWIDSLVQSMMDDAPFDDENFQKYQMVREIAIDMHKKRNANDYLAEEGLIQENVVRDAEGDIVTDKNGDIVTDAEENPVNLAYDRLDRTLTRKMKELGILDDPDSARAEAEMSIAEQLAAMREDGD